MDGRAISKQDALIAKVVAYEAALAEEFPQIENNAKAQAREAFKRGVSKTRSLSLAEIKEVKSARADLKAKFFASEDEYAEAMEAYNAAHRAAVASFFPIVKRLFSAVGDENPVGVVVDDGDGVLLEVYKQKPNRLMQGAVLRLEGEPLVTERVGISVPNWSKFYDVWGDEIGDEHPENQELRICFLDEATVEKNGKSKARVFIRDI